MCLLVFGTFIGSRSVSPEGTAGTPGIYHRCFANIATGTLTSASSINTVTGKPNSFNRAYSFISEDLNGIYYSKVNSSSPIFSKSTSLNYFYSSATIEYKKS